MTIHHPDPHPVHHPVRNFIWFLTGVCLTAVVLAVFGPWRVDAAPAPGESTYVPVAPCRLMDTRPGADNVGPRSTPIIGGEPYTQQVTGPNGECTVPTTASAVALNVTALNGTERSFLTLFPDGEPPQASNLNWVAGQPPSPNKVDVKLAGDGSVKLFNAFGSVDVIADVTGYYTDSTITDLESRLAAVEAKLASMSVETVDGQPTVRFSGVNVQVVDGSGDTDGDVNGLGNLIVGYNRNGFDDDRTGSHNLVIGDLHSYTSHGGLIAGVDNRVDGVNSTVAGGARNVASGIRSSVLSGYSNEVTGVDASVLGGWNNAATGEAAVVAGGRDNTAQGESSVVTGGRSNTATDVQSVVVGGISNSAGVNDVTVGGDNRRCDAGGTNAYVCGEGAWLEYD